MRIRNGGCNCRVPDFRQRIFLLKLKGLHSLISAVFKGACIPSGLGKVSLERKARLNDGKTYKCSWSIFSGGTKDVSTVWQCLTVQYDARTTFKHGLQLTDKLSRNITVATKLSFQLQLVASFEWRENSMTLTIFWPAKLCAHHNCKICKRIFAKDHQLKCFNGCARADSPRCVYELLL